MLPEKVVAAASLAAVGDLGEGMARVGGAFSAQWRRAYENCLLQGSIAPRRKPTCPPLLWSDLHVEERRLWLELLLVFLLVGADPQARSERRRGGRARGAALRAVGLISVGRHLQERV